MASHYIALTAEDFLDEFEGVWEQHIDFGTSRSHKKLLGKKRAPEQWQAQLEAKREADRVRESGATSADGEAPSSDDDGPPARPPRDKQKRKRRDAGPDRVKARAGAGAAAVAQGTVGAVGSVMANKGRFGSTLAAQLLRGA